ncbi:hypothetical protein SSP531S_10800 [Streptomyces spongiicola]|uniref:Uncharacterized protein n=1 Tax=Streptomyces spongiicola TaxID=1690221 RepID=A0A388SXF9_9ACTN|nr:hypothetical protein SSP531S_10800 [Streptomyces spongiicola]
MRAGERSPSPNTWPSCGQVFSEVTQIFDIGGVAISPMGEEEVKVAKSEAPVLTGAWCKRDMLRN